MQISFAPEKLTSLAGSIFAFKSQFVLAFSTPDITRASPVAVSNAISYLVERVAGGEVQTSLILVEMVHDAALLQFSLHT